ncbi:MAG TPA: hypothetical protein VIN04_10970 [Myxococcota bacterium]
MTRYGDTLSVREARARYFRDNGFGEDGGYGAAWVKLQMGPLTLPLPNTPQRVRAVRFHDLHHVVTGYATDWTGEAEIAAWEIASGCADHHAAWLLNLWAMAIGLLIAPGRVWRAFVRGRRSRNLYREPWSEALLEPRVGELRARLGLDDAAAASSPARAAERAAFAGWCAASAALALLTLAVALAPLAGVAWLGARVLA